MVRELATPHLKRGLIMEKEIKTIADIEKITVTLLNKKSVVMRPPNQWTISTMKLKYGNNLEKKLQTILDNYIDNLEDVVWLAWQSVENKDVFNDKDKTPSIKVFTQTISENEDDLQVIVQALFELWTGVLELLVKILKDQGVDLEKVVTEKKLKTAVKKKPRKKK